MNRKHSIFTIIFTLCMIFFTVHTHARCTRTSIPNAADGASALINVGKLNVTSDYLQPAGSLLGQTIVPSSLYIYGGAKPESVLWTCDEADLPNIYFLVATNGDDRVGGFYELGTADGVPGAYATMWRYVAVKLSMSGVVFDRLWKRLDITSYEKTSAGKINIRLMDIPPLEVSFFKVSQIPANQAASNWCGIGTLPLTGSYTCTQPSGYIQLAGTDNVTFGFAHDNIGDDSAYNFRFWGAYNGFGYRIASTSSLGNAATCVARSATPTVNFNSISSAALLNGSSTEANFNVQVECSDSAISGTASNQTAIGFQPSSGAFKAAQNLGLVLSNGAVQYLVSDDYGTDTNLAEGVGISLRNAGNGKNMIFLNQFGLVLGGGEAAGWYPVLDGTPSKIGSEQTGYNSYLQTYTAILKTLPGQMVKPGKVKATATVVVKVQ